MPCASCRGLVGMMLPPRAADSAASLGGISGLIRMMAGIGRNLSAASDAPFVKRPTQNIRPPVGSILAVLYLGSWQSG